MSALERAARTADADALCQKAFDQAFVESSVGMSPDGVTTGVALVAVGGFGRGELAPFSDLDVVLVSEDGIELGEAASTVWYPLWDSGAKLDHSVRSMSEMLTQAAADVRVALGLLDVRHLAGDTSVTLQLRTQVLAQWRRDARDRLPELRSLVDARHGLMGELAHASVPDIKEGAGGLRDATILKAIVATWLVDVAHTDLERSRQDLLDVRDHVHAIVGRAADRITPEVWGPLAERLGFDDERSAQMHVRRLGRRITHLTRLSWRRVDAALSRPRNTGGRRPEMLKMAAGVAISGGEVVLDKNADPATDPLLFLRAATAAAENDVILAPPTVARLAARGNVIPVPWPAEARQLLVRMLAAGKGLLSVWETLDETGALDSILPEWERIRLLPHASVIHRFTVDRHVIETCVEASNLIRRVGRPDVLMVAALLHDIGKGGVVEHSVAGAPIAREIATRLGFDDHAVDLIETLVRWHLLLSTTATTRDPDDPATVEAITSRISDTEAIALLAALTEADARATSPKAWTAWRSSQILQLSLRAQASVDAGETVPLPAPAAIEIPKIVRKGGIDLQLEEVGDGERITVIAKDRVGLMADVAGAFASLRFKVRGARVWPQAPYGISVWDLDDQGIDPRVVRTRLEAIVEGRFDARERLAPAKVGALPPSVVVRPEASTQSTVLEVRASDRPGTVYLVCAALASLGMSVRSAHVDTLGPQAVDVFYVQESNDVALSDERAAEAAGAVRAALA